MHRQRIREGRSRRYGILFTALCLLLAVVVTTSAHADTPPSFVPTMQAVEEAEHYDAGMQSIETQPTDQQAAEALPLEDLGRTEALELLRRVFGSQLQAPGSLFGELEAEKFLSNHVALVETNGKPALLDSTLPLRVPGLFGREEQVDLGLEHAEGEIQPANPLTEAGIPSQLGEGIELPGAGIEIEIVGAPEDRTASIVEGAAAVYPNVAEDTDFAVAPTPTGVETFTQIRSPQASSSQTLRFDLPAGASLQASGEGAAEILEDGEAVVGVHPPSAIDAAGAQVPVSVQVDGDTITYTAEPGPNAIFPLLLDPVVEEYTWGNGNQTNMSDWQGESSIPMLAKTKAECESWCAGYLANGSNGLWIADYTGWKNSGAAVAGFKTFVPRWLSDWTTYGNGPTSYITHATYYALSFQHRTDTGFSPQLIGGLVAPELGSFVTSFSRNGGQPNLSLDSLPYQMTGNSTAKEAQFVLLSSEARYLSANRDAWMGWATIEVTDANRPNPSSFQSAPQWVNNSPSSAIPFSVSDTGLGVSSITLSDSNGHSWKTTYNNCTGADSSPCPRVWSSSSGPQLTYDPSVLPQGTTNLSAVAIDPVGHASNVALGSEAAIPITVQVKVDHTAPALTLSGTMTQQGTVGTTLPQYTLKYVAKDGSAAGHQSGVASVEVKVDNTKIAEPSQSPGCSTQDCELSKEWTLKASSYSAGSHTVEVIAKDAVGLETKQKLTISLNPDQTSPNLSLSGQIPSAPEGWVEQKTYTFTANATDAGGYGVSYFEYKVDGVIKSLTSPVSCPAGGCAASKTWNINAALYGGGAHKIEVIAHDGAGNVRTAALTMNVDPQGVVNATEATKTLEAVEETSEEAAPVASTSEFLEPQVIEAGDNPGFVAANGAITSEGVTTETTIDQESEDITVEGADGPITLSPAGPGSASAPQVNNGVAAVAGSTGTGVDTVVRPEYNGAFIFNAIREAASPEKVTWHVNLGPDQHMESIDNRFVGVFFEDGTEAFLIEAGVATDATGAVVPTLLEVEGGNITLVVEHRSKSYVYPVLAGPHLETSYTAVVDPNVTVEEPFQAEAESAYATLPPMNLEEFDDATESLSAGMLPPPAHREKSKPIHSKEARHILKSGHLDPGATQSIGGPGPSGGETEHSEGYEAKLCASFPSCSTWSMALWGRYWRKTNYAEVDDADYKIHCEAHVAFWWSFNLQNSVDHCGHRGVTKVKRGSGEHLIFYVQFHLDIEFVPEITDPHVLSRGLELVEWVFPNGYRVQHWRNWDDPNAPEEA